MSGAAVDWLLGRPRSVLLACASICALLALAAANVTVDGRLEALVPEEDAHVAQYLDVLRELGTSQLVYVDVAAREPAVRERALERVQERLGDSPLMEEVFGRADMDHWVSAMELVHRATPLYLLADDYAEIERRLEPQALAERMEQQVAKLLEPGGRAHEMALRSDPLAIRELALRRLVGAAPGSGTHSADGGHDLVVAMAAAPIGDEDAAVAIESLMEELATEAEQSGAHLTWLGGHRFYLANARAIKRDVTRVSIAGLLLVLVVVSVCFPGIRTAAVAAVTAAVAGLTALATAVLLFDHVSGVALAFGAALTGICVDYVVHLHVAPRRGESRRRAVRRTYAGVAPSVAIGAVTSAAAFLLLGASAVEAHRQIGMAAGAGVLGAALFALSAGPVIASAGREPATARRTPLAGLMRRSFVALSRRPRLGLIAAVVVVSCGALGITRLRVESDLRRFESKDDATLAAEASFSRTWGDLVDRALVVVDADDAEAALSRTEEVLDRLGPAPSLVDRMSAAAALPSRARQQRRAERWRSFWDEARVAAFRSELAGSVEGLGMRPEAFAPFFEWVGRPVPRLTRAQVEETALAPIVARHLRSRANGGTTSLIVLSGRPGAELSDLPGVSVLTGSDLGEAVVGATREQFTRLALPALAAVMLLLWAYYRRLRRAAAAMAPLLGGALLAGGLLGFSGEPLSLMNLPMIVPTVGFAVDYGIFTLDALAEAESLVREGAGREAALDLLGARGAAIFGAALTTGAGGVAMLLADHPAVNTLGAALVLAVGSCALVAWLALPALSGNSLEEAEATAP